MTSGQKRVLTDVYSIQCLQHSDAAQTDSERDANGDLIERYSCRYVKIAFDALFRDMVLNSEVGSP